MPTASPAWERLGEQLVRRRIEVDPRYSNRQLFANERGVNYRTINDIERGRRANYEDATIASIEVAYAVRPGSIRRAVAGGDIEPVPAPALRPVPSPDLPDSPSERELARLVRDHPDDEVIALMAAQRRKAAAEIVGEIYRWLDFLAAQGGRGENGASAGLPERKPSGNVKIVSGHGRTPPIGCKHVLRTSGHAPSLHAKRDAPGRRATGRKERERAPGRQGPGELAVMTSLAVLRNDEPEGEADVGRAAADALASIEAAIRDAGRLPGSGEPRLARLLAETAIRVTEAAVAAEELTRAVREMQDDRSAADAIAAAAYERCRADGAAARRLTAVP